MVNKALFLNLQRFVSKKHIVWYYNIKEHQLT